MSRTLIATSPPTMNGEAGHRVVWRNWRLVPDRAAGGGIPLLTGLLGFPWRTPHMQARCTNPRGAASGLWAGTSWWGAPADRHHDLVPDPGCTCGIYASADGWQRPPRLMAGRRHPTVAGFVELVGRTLEKDGILRAQGARMVGPLSLVFPKRRIAGLRLRARRVVTEADRYRFVFVESSLGESVQAWAMRTTAGLERRYRVEVHAAR